MIPCQLCMLQTKWEGLFLACFLFVFCFGFAPREIWHLHRKREIKKRHCQSHQHLRETFGALRIITATGNGKCFWLRYLHVDTCTTTICTLTHMHTHTHTYTHTHACTHTHTHTKLHTLICGELHCFLLVYFVPSKHDRIVICTTWASWNKCHHCYLLFSSRRYQHLLGSLYRATESMQEHTHTHTQTYTYTCWVPNEDIHSKLCFHVWKKWLVYFWHLYWGHAVSYIAYI